MPNDKRNKKPLLIGVAGIAIIVVLIIIAQLPGVKAYRMATMNAPVPKEVQDVPKVDEIARYGREYAKQAIAKSAKDPESLHFLEQLGEQWRPEAQVLDVKYRITATNSFGGRVQGMGVASMAYKGGDPYKAENWAVVTAGILE